jgi:hypothetical protein
MIMSDNDVEYVDEDGNPVDPSELGDDYEIVEEVESDEEVIQIPADTAAAPAPAAPQPAPAPAAPAHGIPKALIAAVVAVVVLVGGGLVWGMSSLGEQNTTDDVKAGAAAKSSEVREQVESKAGEADPRADWTACDHIHTATASAAGDDKYDSHMRLRLLSTAPMPRQVVDVVDREDLAATGLTILQLSKTEFGVYAPAPANKQANGRTEMERWAKAAVTVNGDTLAVADGGETDGSDEDAAPTCTMLDDRPMYIEGDVPAGAQDIRDGIAKVLRAKGSVNGQLGVVILDDAALTVGLVELTYAEGGDGE